eukprot:365393-Chlamydomonas_euryale.AAC.4
MLCSLVPCELHSQAQHAGPNSTECLDAGCIPQHWQQGHRARDGNQAHAHADVAAGQQTGKAGARDELGHGEVGRGPVAGWLTGGVTRPLLTVEGVLQIRRESCCALFRGENQGRHKSSSGCPEN